MTWSDKKSRALISAVELNESLWNISLNDYRNRALKDSIWSGIVTDLFPDCTSSELQAKWKNLRVQFRRSYNNYKNKKSGQAFENITPWKFYRQMMFLEKAEEEQATISESNLVLNEQDSLDGMSPEKNVKRTSPEHTIGKRKRTSSEKNCDEYYKKAAFDGMQKALSKLDESDSFQTFGNYVASELRKISDIETANRIQRKLNRTLLDCFEDIDWAATAESAKQSHDQSLGSIEQSHETVEESYDDLITTDEEDYAVEALDG